MFKFLREKIKNSIAKISKKIDEEGSTGKIEEQKTEEVKEEIKEEEFKEEEKRVEEEYKEISVEGAEKEIKEVEEVKEEKKQERFDVDELLDEIEKETEKEQQEALKLEQEKRIEEERRKESEKKEEIAEEVKKEDKKGFFSKLKEKLHKKEEPVREEPKKEVAEEAAEEGQIEEAKEEKIIEEEKKETKDTEEPKEKFEKPAETEVPKEEPEKKKGFFEKIKEKIETKKISEKQFDEIFWELETALLENNVAVEVIEKIKNDLKEKIVEKPIRRYQIESIIEDSLKNSIMGLLEMEQIDLAKKIREKKEKPFVIAFVGINGSGKTTTIAKMAKMLKDKKISCVLAASDTFRAASIEQLQQHADALGIKMIKHDYGSDPAAVAFDAIKHAKSKNIDAVLIDTAGRMHSNINLIDEMKKIVRVANPDLKLFIGEAITGNDCIEQAKTFNDAIGIDGAILAKADVDEKGGASVSVSYVTKKPIFYLGTGQGYDDLEAFDRDKIMENLGLAA